jgi:hypothetical protein
MPFPFPQRCCFCTKHFRARCFGIIRWKRLVPPTLDSATAPKLLFFELRCCQGRRAAHTSERLSYCLPRNDSGSPAGRTNSAYVHCWRSIQYNLTANRRATITSAVARLPLRLL